MVEFIEVTRPEAVAVHIHGIITQDDYGRLMPVIVNKMGTHGKIPILVKLGSIDIESAKTLYGGTGFDLKLLTNLSKVAVVSDDKQYEWIINMAKMFIPAEVRLFTVVNEASAISWIGG